MSTLERIPGTPDRLRSGRGIGGSKRNGMAPLSPGDNTMSATSVHPGPPSWRPSGGTGMGAGGSASPFRQPPVAVSPILSTWKRLDEGEPRDVH
jgi:hypothetical protein